MNPRFVPPEERARRSVAVLSTPRRRLITRVGDTAHPSDTFPPLVNFAGSTFYADVANFHVGNVCRDIPSAGRGDKWVGRLLSYLNSFAFFPRFCSRPFQSRKRDWSITEIPDTPPWKAGARRCQQNANPPFCIIAPYSQL